MLKHSYTWTESIYLSSVDTVWLQQVFFRQMTTPCRWSTINTCSFPTLELVKLNCRAKLALEVPLDVPTSFCPNLCFWKSWSITVPDNKAINFSQKRSQLPHFLVVWPLFLEDTCLWSALLFSDLGGGCGSIGNSLHTLNKEGSQASLVCQQQLCFE